MATPLTLYVPLKQDAATQAEAENVYKNGFGGVVHKEVAEAEIIHYARIALIPNASGKGYLALLLITTFDGPMNPYLKFFWNAPGIQALFNRLIVMALNPPNPPVKDLTSFEIFINKNNLSMPQDLVQAYPQTVPQIYAKFPPS